MVAFIANKKLKKKVDDKLKFWEKMQTDVRTYVFNINNNIMIPTKTVEFSVLDQVKGYLIIQSNHVKSKTLTKETKKPNRNELKLSNLECWPR